MDTPTTANSHATASCHPPRDKASNWPVSIMLDVIRSGAKLNRPTQACRRNALIGAIRFIRMPPTEPTKAAMVM